MDKIYEAYTKVIKESAGPPPQYYDKHYNKTDKAITDLGSDMFDRGIKQSEFNSKYWYKIVDLFKGLEPKEVQDKDRKKFLKGLEGYGDAMADGKNSSPALMKKYFKAWLK